MKRIILFILLISALGADYYWEKSTLLSDKQKDAYNPTPLMIDGKLWTFWEEQYKEGSRLRVALRQENGSFVLKTIYKNKRRFFYQFSVIPTSRGKVHAAVISPDRGILVIEGDTASNKWKMKSSIPFSLNKVFNPRLYYRQDNGKLYLFYLVNDKGIMTIRYKISDDLGSTWQDSPVSITTDKDLVELNQLYFPAVTDRDGLLYVFYQKRNPVSMIAGDDEIYMAVIDENSKTDIQVTHNEDFDYNPRIISDDKYIYLMWNRYHGGNWEVCFQRITPIGTAIDKDHFQVVSSDSVSALNPRFSIVSNRIYFSWTSFHNNYFQVMGREYFYELNILGKEFFFMQNRENTVQARIIQDGEIPNIVFLKLDKKERTQLYFSTPDRTVPAVEITSRFPRLITDLKDLRVEWRPVNDSSGISGYGYMLDNSPVSEPIQINIGSNRTSMFVGDLVKPGSNFFHITAFDVCGNLSQVTTVRLNVAAVMGEISEEYGYYLRLHQAGEYRRVVNELKKPKALDQQYIKGISYFSLSRDTSLPLKKREDYRDYAIRNLKEVGEKAFNPGLKARAKLWHGVVVHYNNSDNRQDKNAFFNLFHIIKNSELKKTRYYNDAIFYIGIMYSDIGEEDRAERYFKLLQTADMIDKKIYDIEGDRWLSLREAYRLGMSILERKYRYMPFQVP